ncbi:hypothetical protein LCGC14_0674730 [marine sediment metagenome]|uniref:Uncharacterized protein n=1 Tax=marine sediment metagenome TaxID=412755 RepID=A0A0F9TBI6_9ZZZZ
MKNVLSKEMTAWILGKLSPKDGAKFMLYLSTGQAPTSNFPDINKWLDDRGIDRDYKKDMRETYEKERAISQATIEGVK